MMAKSKLYNGLMFWKEELKDPKDLAKSHGISSIFTNPAFEEG